MTTGRAEHDAPLFHSKRAVQILLVIEVLLMLALIKVAGMSLHVPATYFLPVYVYVLAVPAAGTTKIVSVLYEVDDGTLPRSLRTFLFRLALLLPVVAGIIPVLLVLRFAGAFAG
jgi:hypothetical protein